MTDQNSKIKYQNLSQSSKPKIEVRYRAFYLSINIVRFLDKLPNKRSIRIMSDQLIRCATSIGANIVEAKSSASKREFINYFQIALKSANETKSWLALLKELIPEYKAELDIFIQETFEISRILASSVLTMKNPKQL